MTVENGTFDVEEIPDEDAISRHIYWPHKFDEYRGVIWEHAFLFSAEAESAVWRKYANHIDEVHRLGCLQQDRKLQTDPGKNFLYKGAMTCLAHQIRGVSIAGGFGFSVDHDPSNGQGRHHAEIRRRHPENMKPSKNQRAHLLTALKEVWSALEIHDCAAKQTP